MRKAASTGQFTIPTAPSAGTAVSSSSSANTYGSYVELLASAADDLFVIGVIATLASTSKPTYCSAALATGASMSEAVVGTVDLAAGFTAGAAGSQVGAFVPLDPWIAVASGERIAAKTADDIASALAWNVKLICINQVDVIEGPNMPALFVFAMTDEAGAGVTGLADGDFTVKEVDLDGAGPNTLTNAISEISDGFYKVTLTAAERGGNLVSLKFVAPGAIERLITFTNA